MQCNVKFNWYCVFKHVAAKWNLYFSFLKKIIAHFDLLFHQCVYHHFTTAGGGWTPKWKKKTVVCSSCSVKYLLFVQVSISSFVLGWNIFLWQTAAMEIFCSARCTVCSMNSGFCEVLPDEFPSECGVFCALFFLQVAFLCFISLMACFVFCNLLCQ